MPPIWDRLFNKYVGPTNTGMWLMHLDKLIQKWNDMPDGDHLLMALTWEPVFFPLEYLPTLKIAVTDLLQSYDPKAVNHWPSVFEWLDSVIAEHPTASGIGVYSTSVNEDSWFKPVENPDEPDEPEYVLRNGLTEALQYHSRTHIAGRGIFQPGEEPDPWFPAGLQ